MDADITTDSTYEGETTGSVTVRDAATLTVAGVHRGSIEVDGGGSLLVEGTVDGAVTVGSLGTVIVTGDIVGPVDVRVAATLVVEHEGRLAGPLTNHGSVTNRGLRAGRVEGRAPDDQPGSVEVPSAEDGGPHNYKLPTRS